MRARTTATIASAALGLVSLALPLSTFAFSTAPLAGGYVQDGPTADGIPDALFPGANMLAQVGTDPLLRPFDARGILEFDISGLTANPATDGTDYQLQMYPFAGYGVTDVYGYFDAHADGVLALDDWGAGTLIGPFQDISQSIFQHRESMNVGVFVNEALAAGATTIGFNLRGTGPDGDYQIFETLGIHGARLLAPIPVPAAALLFSSALGLLGWARQRQATL